MDFREIDDLLSDLSAHLTTENEKKGGILFREKRILHGTASYEKLFETIPDLTKFPAIVLSSGDMNFPMEYGGCVRESQLYITFVSRPFGNAEKEMESNKHFQELLNTLSGDYPGRPLILNNVPMIKNRAEKISYTQEYLVWNISISAQELTNI